MIFFHKIPKSERKEKLVSNEAVEFATNIAIDVAETPKISPDPKHARPEYVPIVTPLQSLPPIGITGATGSREAALKAEVEDDSFYSLGPQVISSPRCCSNSLWLGGQMQYYVSCSSRWCVRSQLIPPFRQTGGSG